MSTKNTFTDILRRFTIQEQNLEEALDKISRMFSEEVESLEIDVKQDDGSVESYQVPTISHLNGRIDQVSNMLDSLIRVNENEIGLELNDGSVKKFNMQNISQIVSDLETINNESLDIPTDFKVKNNWFFEEFLNPLLYINIDVSNYVTDQIDQFNTKRIILNTQNQTQIDYFNNNINGRNDIDLETLITELETQGIPYNEDDNIVDLPVSINGKTGSFSVLRIFEEEIEQNNQTIVRHRYKLDSIYYTDITSDTRSSTILTEGDVLVTNQGAEYSVQSVNASERTVILEKQFGVEGITIGADTLRIKPEPIKIPDLQLNVGYDERQIVFVKPINKRLDLTTDVWSAGFAFYSNELNITLPDGGETTLENYYNNFVSDFGLLFMNFAKERQIPANLGELPDPPTLAPQNFEVVPTNDHIKQSEAIQNLKQKIADKEQLENQIDEINSTINDLKSSLNDESNNQNERLKIRKSIREKSNEKDNLYSQLVTLINEITNQLRSNPQFNVENKYRVQGFWDIPAPKSNEYGEQKVVQFQVEYRYLNKNGNSGNTNQQTFVDNQGGEKQATFSQWHRFMTNIREKVYNEDTGTYQWANENVRDPDTVNSNQLDIPIEKGENVEIRIRSISEAGYPVNPIKSEWSPSVVVEFPEELESQQEDSIVSQQLFSDQIRVQFENELAERGVDIHLLNSFTSNDRYFAHRATDIASGFFNQNNNVLDLYEKMKQMQDRIDALEAAVNQTKGVLRVSIVDESGNVTQVNNNSEVELFGGFYKDEITESTGATTTVNHGEIVSKTYVVSLENTSQTPLALVARVAGGIDERVPNDDENNRNDGDEDYKQNRQYDRTPLSIITQEAGSVNGFKHRAPFQSSQVRSQFIYSRFMRYGLDEPLYLTIDSSYLDTSYDFKGQSVFGEKVPYNWGHYLPYKPNYDAHNDNNTHNEVWDGVVNGDDPQGGGILTEFCIHTDHPELTSDYNSSTFRPEFPTDSNGDLTGEQAYLPFAHAVNFERGSNRGGPFFGVGNQQVEYKLPASLSDNNNRNESHYPIKIGFKDNDQYLIGKYTCGAYLYMAPKQYQNISIEGNHPTLSRRELDFGSENSINIPVIFQYRASDILGNVGGYRVDEDLTNISYTKTIGIDVYIKDSQNRDANQPENIFSFDIKATCRYTRDIAAVNPVNIPTTGQFDQISFDETFN